MSVIRFPIERRHAPQMVTLSELRGQLGGSDRWWRYRLREGLPHRRWGRRLMFDPSEVQQWLEARYSA